MDKIELKNPEISPPFKLNPIFYMHSPHKWRVVVSPPEVTVTEKAASFF